MLEKLDDELRFVLIASEVNVLTLEELEDGTATEVDGLSVRVEKLASAKCERCWHHREDVGADDSHQLLCGRCIENVEGAGEQRSFA